MIEITKEVARKFFETEPRQELVLANGHAIWSLESYLKDGAFVELKKEDIEHLEFVHFSGDDYKDTIFSHETGERMESLTGIDNKDFLIWFAEQIGADISYAFTFFGRGKMAQFMCVQIFDKLEEIADFTDEELKEVEERAKKLSQQ